jgi:SagB-type dehydrogenase family enzyme
MSTAVTYHEATKYRPETIAQSGGIDWSQQPLPYKEYDCRDPIELSDYLPFDPNPFTGRQADADAQALVVGEISLAALSHLVFFTYGVTGVVPNEPRNLLLRAAPSAGGLYPSELYVIIRQCPDCEPGLYGYDPAHHRLIPLWAGSEIAEAVAESCYGNAAVINAPILFVVTGVFARSSWRYGERAYRRILLDTGHLLANATLVAHQLKLRTSLTAAFCDERLNTILRVDPLAEGALAIVSFNLTGPNERPVWAALPSSSSEQTPQAPLLNALHQASVLVHERPVVISRGENQADELEQRYGVRGGESLTLTNDTVPLAINITQAILRRRSTRRYRRAIMSRQQLARILSTAYRPDMVGLGQQPSLDRSLLMTFVAVLAVEGLATGVYYYAPHSNELRLISATCARDALQFLCLGQELGGDAAVVIFHTADLQRAVRYQGERAYRYLHLDAGMIGERLDLAALCDGLGASGIGGFFDDHVNRLLGIPAEQAVVYITTIGMPLNATTSVDS